MKYQEALLHNRAPEWRNDYINYEELKNLIYKKEQTAEVNRRASVDIASAERTGPDSVSHMVFALLFILVNMLLSLARVKCKRQKQYSACCGGGTVHASTRLWSFLMSSSECKSAVLVSLHLVTRQARRRWCGSGRRGQHRSRRSSRVSS